MYIPKHFQINDPERIHQLIEDFSFGLLITQVEELCANHLPFQLIKGSDGVPDRLIAHMARANPQWQVLEKNEQVLAVFSGPHSYISPDAYPNPQVNVPTWNYLTVHAYGKARLLEAHELSEAMSQAVLTYEGETSEAWTRLESQSRDRKLKAIVGFEISVARYHAKSKLSQNRNHEDQIAIIRSLESRADENSLAIAQEMKTEMKSTTRSSINAGGI